MRPFFLMVPLVVACAGTATDDPGVDGDTDVAATLPPPADPKPYSGGECPDMTGTVSNFKAGSLSNRSFIVREPTRKKNAGVLFLWHGNGDTASNFDAYMRARDLADELGVFVITSESGPGGVGVDWAVPPSSSAPDLALFDDVLACLNEQYELDLSRVYTMGFSAGALWSSYLLMVRTDHLAAGVTFSGGSDGSAFGLATINPWEEPSWAVPVLMTHGGAADEVIVNFRDMTLSMSEKLRDGGSTAIVCNHGDGHTVPGGWEDWAVPFLDAHRFGMAPSPYADGQDPSGELPRYCKWD